jgi:hypothetical protein
MSAFQLSNQLSASSKERLDATRIFRIGTLTSVLATSYDQHLGEHVKYFLRRMEIIHLQEGAGRP